jgi:hypothetical protein
VSDDFVSDQSGDYLEHLTRACSNNATCAQRPGLKTTAYGTKRHAEDLRSWSVAGGGAVAAPVIAQESDGSVSRRTQPVTPSPSDGGLRAEAINAASVNRAIHQDCDERMSGAGKC